MILQGRVLPAPSIKSLTGIVWADAIRPYRRPVVVYNYFFVPSLKISRLASDSSSFSRLASSRFSFT